MKYRKNKTFCHSESERFFSKYTLKTKTHIHVCAKLFFSFITSLHILAMKDQEFISAIEQHVIDFVKELREEKNLTQRDIASIIGKTPSFVGNVESINNRAKYNLTHINLLADYFELSPQAFLPEKPINKKTKRRKKAI